MPVGSHVSGMRIPGEAMEGLGAIVKRVASPDPASNSSTPILPEDILVALGGLPVTSAASAHTIAMGWPQDQSLCASVLREGKLISPIWLTSAGGGSPWYGSRAAMEMRCEAGKKPVEAELDHASMHMVAQQRLQAHAHAHMVAQQRLQAHARIRVDDGQQRDGASNGSG